MGESTVLCSDALCHRQKEIRHSFRSRFAAECYRLFATPLEGARRPVEEQHERRHIVSREVGEAPPVDRCDLAFRYGDEL